MKKVIGSILVLSVLLCSCAKTDDSTVASSDIPTQFTNAAESVSYVSEPSVAEGFEIVGGDLGNYGQVTVLNRGTNPETNYCYSLPVGSYKIKNNSSDSITIKYCSDLIEVDENGVETWADAQTLTIEANSEITIEFQEFYMLIVGDNVTLEVVKLS